MPTTRKRKSRTRKGDVNINSWIRWRTSILKYMPISVRSDNPWTDETAQLFWEENKNDIMAVYLELQRQDKDPFQRPDEYLAELEAAHPRRKTGVEKSYSPRRPDGSIEELSEPVYENNKRYLKRLNLLQEWETKCLT